jgi:hypothetical protein
MNWIKSSIQLGQLLSNIEPRLLKITVFITRLLSYMKYRMKWKETKTMNRMSDQRVEYNNRTLAGMHREIDKAEDKELRGEVDPNGTDAHSLGSKLDAGKPDCSLLGMFGRALLQVSRVGTFGADKYSRGGWQHVPDGFNRYTAAMLRHYLAENTSKVDSELPVLHAAQVAWNALARLEFMVKEYEDSVEAEERGG